MPILIKTFGKLTEILASKTVLLTDAPKDTDALKASLLQRFPALDGLKFFIAVNNKMVQENTPLDEDVVVALLPPFSGG